jgi:hypothetical protein
MPKRYAQILRDTISDRALEIENDILARDSGVLELNAKIHALLAQIEQNLPPGLQQLVLDLDDRIIEQEVLAHAIMYGQGVKDGFNFRRFLKRWGNK